MGTNLSIISEVQAREDNPDYFLVLPWHLIDAFTEREAEYLGKGGQFIVPLPELVLVSKDGVRKIENSKYEN